MIASPSVLVQVVRAVLQLQCHAYIFFFLTTMPYVYTVELQYTSQLKSDTIAITVCLWKSDTIAHVYMLL